MTFTSRWFLLHYSLVGKMSMVKAVTQRFCFLFRHYMIILKHNFLGLQYYIISQTLITRRAMHLRFVKLETLFNNAFKETVLCKVELFGHLMK